MTLTRFVSKNAFRNKRRSILTVLEHRLLAFAADPDDDLMAQLLYGQRQRESNLRLITRHKVSLTFNLPGYYREKIRSMPGVVAVVPTSWFGGLYKDDKPENFFAQFGTDPDEFFKVYRDITITPKEVSDWQHDRAGSDC